MLQPRQVHAPEIAGIWLNSPPLTMGALRGKVVLIDFWDYTCLNCIRTLPYLREWHRRYRDKGLVIVGVHAPEFFFARDTGNVERAVRLFELEYPVVVDNDYRVWHAFANRYWPAEYLVDKEGYIRYTHTGEGRYRETEIAVQELLREINPDAHFPDPMPAVRPMDDPGAHLVCERPTPELYLGAQRGRIANHEDPVHERVAMYRFGETVPPGAPELAGPWIIRPECAEAALGPDGESSRLRLAYSAAEVNLVIAPPASGTGSLEILDNGLALDHQSRGADVREAADGSTRVGVEFPRMYSLVRRDRFLTRTLELATRSAAVQLFAFTFVSCVPRP